MDINFSVWIFFKNEAYFDAIDLYKKGEVKEKDIEENELDPSEWINDLYQYLKGICDG